MATHPKNPKSFSGSLKDFIYEFELLDYKSQERVFKGLSKVTARRAELDALGNKPILSYQLNKLAGDISSVADRLTAINASIKSFRSTAGIQARDLRDRDDYKQIEIGDWEDG